MLFLLLKKKSGQVSKALLYISIMVTIIDILKRKTILNGDDLSA